MARSWRWHILLRHVITSWEKADLLGIDLWVLPSALLLYRKNIKQIFVSETTMPSSLIFGMQHHLVIFIQFGAQALSVDPPAGSHVHYRNLVRQSPCLTPQGIEH